MKFKRVSPILNVTDLEQSFAWFANLGWKKGWDYGDPPNFGGIENGDLEIYLCVQCQGGQGEDASWMSWWLESPKDVDAAYEQALKDGIEVVMPPRDCPWNTHEFHVRHPDGHTFRIGASLEED